MVGSRTRHRAKIRNTLTKPSYSLSAAVDSGSSERDTQKQSRSDLASLGQNRASRSNTMHKPRALILTGLLLSALSASPAPEQEWQPAIRYTELGNSDLNDTYYQLLDYLLPRKVVHPDRVKCSYVLRFIPESGPEHQVNILRPESSSGLEIWTFELDEPLTARLASSEQAPTLAKTIQVKKRRLSPDRQLTRLLDKIAHPGINQPISPAIPLHGDNYRLWASCEASHIDVAITLPSRETNSLSIWMNSIWSHVTCLKPVPDSP